MIYFTKEHEWALVEGNEATIGITDHAQHSLGDVVYLELPEPGKKLEKHKIFGVVESVKAVSDLFSPISGSVIKTNQELVQNPEQVNQDPMGKAWMVKVSMDNPSELDSLMNSEAYQKYLKEEVK
ncbi:MAG: glycine cleavage system protein GcvH [Myxococcaceae bacterium]